MSGATVVGYVDYRVSATTGDGKPAWKAEIKVNANGNSFIFEYTVNGDLLAREVVARLAADNILTRCPKPR